MKMEIKNPRTLRIYFTKPKKGLPILSYAIRLLTWSKFSHCVWNFIDTPASKENFHVYFNKLQYLSYDNLNKNHEVVSMFRLVVPEERYNIIKGRCDKFNGKETKGYYLQLLGAALSIPHKLIMDTWAPNPLKFHDSYLCSQYIMEDLMKSLDLFMYVDVKWYDSLYGLDTFTEKELYNFLMYLSNMDQTKLPITIKRIF